MMQEVDDEFYNRADAHIHLANDQSDDIGRGKVSASFMFALSRFNAYVRATGFDSHEEMMVGKKEAIEFYVDQYRKMLDENYDDYLENYDKYMSNSG
jgi:hypothetical protein